MVKVIYHRNLNRVSVSGHALSGEKGHDLVCASVTALAYTLAAFVTNMGEARQVYNPKVEMKDGDALIVCDAPGKYKNGITLVFDAICGGFDLLAKQCPDNVSYEMR